MSALENQNEKLENRVNRETLSQLSKDIYATVDTIVEMNTVALNSMDDKEQLLKALQKSQNASEYLLALLHDIINDTDREGKEDIAETEDKEGALHIIVAEDNPFNLEIVSYALKNAGHHVYEAEDGKKAVELFEQSKIGSIDAIYMDIVMPKMDGLEATKVIRAMNREDAKSVPIIAMTACTFEDDKKKAKQAGMTEYITKPLQISRVLSLLK